MKIGFFGGSFNPPTKAHIDLAKMAIKEKNLDKVVFVPIGDFYEKKDLEPIDIRIKMLKLICDKEEKLEVSELERDFKEKKFAIDVFKFIENKYKYDDFYFLMGSDNYQKMPTWKGFDELKKYKYIVFERNQKIVNNDFENTFYINNNETREVSSTQVRKKIRDKEEMPCVLDKDVEQFILDNKLYTK